MLYLVRITPNTGAEEWNTIASNLTWYQADDLIKDFNSKNQPHNLIIQKRPLPQETPISVPDWLTDLNSLVLGE